MLDKLSVICINDSSEDDQDVNGDMTDIQAHLMHKVISRSTDTKLLTILKLQGKDYENSHIKQPRHSHINQPRHQPQWVDRLKNITLQGSSRKYILEEEIEEI